MEQVSDRCPALGKSIFRRMEAEHFERVCAARTIQRFGPGAVMEYVARKMKVNEDVLMALTQRPVRRRVADILLLLHGHSIDGDDWDPFPLTHLKRKEIAQLVSTTPEVLQEVDS